MTQDQLLHVLSRRTPFRVSRRLGFVLVWDSPWHGVIVRPGKVPRLVPVIPDLVPILISCVLVFLPMLLKKRTDRIVAEIADVLLRELDVKTEIAR